MVGISCTSTTLRRKKCYSVYGKLGEDCLVEELEEKRCVSFQYCSREAHAYYGSLDGTKAVCASWAEAFCFADGKHILQDDSIKEYHEKSREVVNANPKAKAECRKLALNLVKCMKNLYT